MHADLGLRRDGRTVRAEIGLRIAEISLAVEADRRVASLVAKRYAGFVTPAPACDWRVRIAVGNGASGPPDVAVERASDCFYIARHDFHGTVDTAARVAEVVVGTARENTVDSALRVVMSLVLGADGGLLVHAASLARGGRGYVFAGPSGSGKTTLARLANADLLSDELSIVRVREDGVTCHGTPFWGELARGGDNRSVPLAGFYRLYKAPEHERRELMRGRALAMLLENVMWFSRDADAVARVVALAADVVERVPCYELHFRRDDGFWTVVDGE